MLKPSSPCLGCEHRNETCHSDCSRYLEYVDENAKYKAIINESKHEQDMGFTLLEQQRNKNQKNKKFKKGCYW